MAIHYRIEGRLLLVEFEGEHAPGEAREVWRAIERDPAFIRPARACIDIRASSALLRRRIADLRGNTEWLIARAKVPGRACAFVARPGLQYGLMRMVGTWLELTGAQVMVSTDYDEALKWLHGLDDRDDIHRDDVRRDDIKACG